MDGDQNACASWLPYAENQLKWMLTNTPSTLSKILRPVDGTEIRLQANPNKIFITSGGRIAVDYRNIDDSSSSFVYLGKFTPTLVKDHQSGFKYWYDKSKKRCISWDVFKVYIEGRSCILDLGSDTANIECAVLILKNQYGIVVRDTHDDNIIFRRYSISGITKTEFVSTEISADILTSYPSSSTLFQYQFMQDGVSLFELTTNIAGSPPDTSYYSQSLKLYTFPASYVFDDGIGIDELWTGGGSIATQNSTRSYTNNSVFAKTIHDNVSHATVVNGSITRDFMMRYFLDEDQLLGLFHTVTTRTETDDTVYHHSIESFTVQLLSGVPTIDPFDVYRQTNYDVGTVVPSQTIIESETINNTSSTVESARVLRFVDSEFNESLFSYNYNVVSDTVISSFSNNDQNGKEVDSCTLVFLPYLGFPTYYAVVSHDVSISDTLNYLNTHNRSTSTNYLLYVSYKLDLILMVERTEIDKVVTTHDPDNPYIPADSIIKTSVSKTNVFKAFYQGVEYVLFEETIVPVVDQISNPGAGFDYVTMAGTSIGVSPGHTVTIVGTTLYEEFNPSHYVDYSFDGRLLLISNVYIYGESISAENFCPIVINTNNKDTLDFSYIDPASFPLSSPDPFFSVTRVNK